jgi:hypothetical protein
VLGHVETSTTEDTEHHRAKIGSSFSVISVISVISVFYPIPFTVRFAGRR